MHLLNRTNIGSSYLTLGTGQGQLYQIFEVIPRLQNIFLQLFNWQIKKCRAAEFVREIDIQLEPLQLSSCVEVVNIHKSILNFQELFVNWNECVCGRQVIECQIPKDCFKDRNILHIQGYEMYLSPTWQVPSFNCVQLKCDLKGSLFYI